MISLIWVMLDHVRTVADRQMDRRIYCFSDHHLHLKPLISSLDICQVPVPTEHAAIALCSCGSVPADTAPPPPFTFPCAAAPEYDNAHCEFICWKSIYIQQRIIKPDYRQGAEGSAGEGMGYLHNVRAQVAQVKEPVADDGQSCCWNLWNAAILVAAHLERWMRPH